MNENAHILLIVLDSVLTDLISEFLKSNGYEVTAVHDGDSGWEKYNKIGPDIIISDTYHKGLNGLDFLRKVRAMDSNTPIIILSGAYPNLIEKESLKLGANAFFPLPFNLDELKICIRKFLDANLSDGNLEEVIMSSHQNSDIRNLDWVAADRKKLTRIGYFLWALIVIIALTGELGLAIVAAIIMAVGGSVFSYFRTKYYMRELGITNREEFFRRWEMYKKIGW